MSYRRISKYVPGCDGTPIAVDIYIPETGVKVPLLCQAGYFNRRENFERQRSDFEKFIDAGYALCLIEPRGQGASYGVSEGFFSRKDARDFAKIIDTLAVEDWCNGKVGMFGGSNLGQSQQITVAEQPKHLLAAAPCDANVNFYYQNFTNGASSLPSMRPGMRGEPPMGAPVDDDPAPDYPMAHEAQKCHTQNLGFLQQYVQNMYRDDVNPMIGYAPNLEVSPWEHMDDIRFGHTALYQNAAWFDPGCTGEILSYKSWGGKLLLGPWGHTEIYRSGPDFKPGPLPPGMHFPDPMPNGTFDWVNEHIRFFDTVLKEKDNTSLAEPPILYYTINDEPGCEWHRAADFPLDTQTSPDLYLSGDGSVSEEKVAPGSIAYAARGDISMFPGFGKMAKRIETPMNEIDAKCVCFDTESLSKDMEITGIPVLEIWVTSTYKDGNFIAALEEVLPDGTSNFITDGAIRASHGEIGMNNIWDSMGLPYHRGYRSDAISLDPERPTALAFNLDATSRIIKKGSRIRVSIHCADTAYTNPVGWPETPPTVTFYFGGETASFLRLPVIAPNVTRFEGMYTANGSSSPAEMYAFKRAVYLYNDGRWAEYPCEQVYPSGNQLLFVTKDFTAVRTVEGDIVTLEVKDAGFAFNGTGKLPDRMTFSDQSTEIKRFMPFHFRRMMKSPIHPNYKNLYVATVPVAKGFKGNMNPQLRSTLDLFIDLALPEGNAEKFPCMVNIHGFGGNSHQFEPIAPALLKRGYAVASIDYRLCPPNIWPSSGVDAKGAIRWLKANAASLRLDPDRFGVIGGSMGGHLTSMIGACNGEPASEGNIGGNTEFTSSVKVAVPSFPVIDFFGFGDDSAEVWPHQPDKVANSDGPFAPLGSMLGYVGPGKGMGELKTHLYDSDPYYKALIALAVEASSVSHVTENSAPMALVHGMFDCGIQVPLGQTMRMFDALTRKGVKALVFLNNNSIFGADPEVMRAIVDFIAARV